MSSHWKGLAVDWIIGATVVLADGRVYEVSKDENKDLLWALQGAGSAFGIVAELRFNTFDAPSNATVFTVALNWNNQQTATTGMNAFRSFAKDTMPAEMNMRLSGNAQGTTLEGVYYGSTQQFNNAIQPLLKNAGGTVRSAKTMGWLESLNAWANNEKLDATYPYSMVRRYKPPSNVKLES
jgi:FAD/FMN-containing dehydrogenase